MRFHHLAAAAIAATLLTSCTQPVAPAATPTLAETAASTQTSTTTPSATQSAAATLSLGDITDLAGGAITVQAQKFKKVTGSSRETPSWAAYIKLCNVSATDPVGPSWDPWSLVTADGQQYKASTETYTGDPTPAYPFTVGDRVLNQGDCAKGWVVFEARKGAAFATLEYDNSAGDHLEWRL